ncbi:MAG: hypothetical protein H6519_08475 [Microthrixaceae bacterium]|nr:hypothetical protein [Acidimicrobiales bacterium]MCB9404457.1 hypothetical protein [Microthrixaceae bacterium]
MTKLDLMRIQLLVEEAVDNGATTVEEIHQAVAATPLGVLGQLEPIAGVVGTAQDLTARSIGAVYDTIRRVNEQVGVFAEQILMTQGEMADKADPEGQ